MARGDGAAGAALDVWPEGQAIQGRVDPAIRLTRFADAERYHAALIARILQLEDDPAASRRYFRAAGGTKILHVDRFGTPEADLIDARARALFRCVLGAAEAVVDLSWANIYRTGDYAMAHSHLRASASVVYCLDQGDPDEDDSLSGQLNIIDPRLAACCQQQQGFMTSPYLPRMEAGTMIIFPSQLVHAVNPYAGRRPRIMLAWNIADRALPGTARAAALS